MRFVCDSTVGKLARILRMAGFDTAYVERDDLARVIALSLEEGRKIISRNSKYGGLRLASDCLCLKVDEPYEQFRQMVSVLGLAIEEEGFLSRCLNCSELLVEVDKEQVRDRLYDFVYCTQERIWRCHCCDRLFWHATHAGAITSRLLQIKAELDQTPRGAADL
jgi:hypothetical protein